MGVLDSHTRSSARWMPDWLSKEWKSGNHSVWPGTYQERLVVVFYLMSIWGTAVGLLLCSDEQHGRPSCGP